MEDVPVGRSTNYSDCELEIRSRLRRDWSPELERVRGLGVSSHLLQTSLGTKVTMEIFISDVPGSAP
ncbi:hypothetical protein GE061_016636 [Apolygus lucorum]|uniref:Uncharacterized protein n=1 Tax=Apolygus lucorum TaxID=248454 RepID=A0A6A4K201_APOLU|nr:hypothetical protein GE061_016636 [Apolygus lucorum]